MNRGAAWLVFGGSALFVMAFVLFMVRMIGHWEVAEAERAARQEAAEVAIEAVQPALSEARTAAEQAQQAAAQALDAVASAAQIGQDAADRATRDIAVRAAEEAFRKLELEREAQAVAEAAAAAVAAVEARAADATYLQARWDPLHFAPAAQNASNAECLVCHQEILERDVRAVTPAGVGADEALAWYQTLDTYEGEQQTFHQRHLTTPFATAVMDLSCSFCHQGLDPREEAAQTQIKPGLTQLAVAGPQSDLPAFTLRKMVNPSDTCLRCHGSFPAEVMGLPGPWHEIRADFEFEPTENGCLTCHGELFRTNRHQVTYLHAENIESLAQESSDACYGCHGGRSWFRISYPYPRHAWPDMPEETPEWALDRPTESDPRYRLTTK